MATAPQPAASLPRVTTIAPGSMLAPNGASAPEAPAAQGQAPPAPAGASDHQQPAAAQAAQNPVPAGQPSAPAAPGDGKEPAAPTGGAKGAAKGAALLGRAMAILPLAAGLSQAFIGLMITRGTIPLAGVPVFGGMPKFLVGMLVAATSSQSIMAGVARIMGKA